MVYDLPHRKLELGGYAPIMLQTETFQIFDSINDWKPDF